MIVSRMKSVTVGLVLIASILAEPGDRIPNHPNCPVDQGPMPVYFVHPTNCSRFYECRQKDAWEFECSAGLHFNSKIDVCDYPANAQCEPQPITTTTNSPTTLVSSTTSTTTVATTDETTPTNSPTTTESTTPSVVVTTTTTPYPTSEDTTPFSTTPEGTTTSHPTPEYTTPFSTTPEGTTPSHPTTEYTTPFSTTPEGTSTSQRPPSSNATPLPECPPFGATHPNYWGEGSDCSRYLGCLENCVQEFKCPDGLYWNDQQKQCDIFGSSNCCPVIPPAPNVWPATTLGYN